MAKKHYHESRCRSSADKAGRSLKRHHSSSSDSSARSIDTKKSRNVPEKYHSKKRSSSTSSTSSCSDSSSDRRRRRKHRKDKRKLKKKKKELKKKMKKEKKKAQEEVVGPNPVKDFVNTDTQPDVNAKSKAMAPMTKEEWEKQQNVVKRVYDEATGRYRLIKGDGEVLEEIVSRDRHREINKQATRGDGQYFQAKLAVTLR